MYILFKERYNYIQYYISALINIIIEQIQIKFNINFFAKNKFYLKLI